jgi:hypothetical protein
MATENKNQGGGRGSNLTDEDRRKGGEHSHGGRGSSQGSNKSSDDRRKGNEGSRNSGKGSK